MLHEDEVDIRSIEVLIENIVLQTEELAKLTFTPGSPSHTFQQSLIKYAEKYRARKQSDPK